MLSYLRSKLYLWSLGNDRPEGYDGGVFDSHRRIVERGDLKARLRRIEKALRELKK